MLILSNINTNYSKKFGEYGIRFYSSRSKHKTSLRKFYQILGVSEDCEDETLRLAFVNLAKKFHPDSGTPEANANQFSEIETAYRQIQKSRNEQREQSNSYNEFQEHDIKHTAPQHRHYLQYDVGLGTPSMRQRRFTMERAQKAIENVMEHRLMKLQAEERNSLIGMDKKRAKDIKTRYGVDRLVEDLIQEAMNKGEFSNLPGMGKPLKNDTTGENPYVDFITHKLNKIMIDNGFTPEWIQLSKEIRENVQELEKKLAKIRNNFGEEPLCNKEKEDWRNSVKNLKSCETSINKMIDKYNLLVPVLQKQKLRINLNELAAQSLSRSPDKLVKTKLKKNVSISRTNSESTNLSDFISSIFTKKS